MKRESSGSKEIIKSALILSAVILILWGIFYITMVRMIRRNMRLQAETGAGAITQAVEDELLGMEDAVCDLADLKEIADLAGSKVAVDFYAKGAAFLETDPVLPGNMRNDDCVVIFNSDGLFYRLKGDLPNTLLRRVFYLCENGDRDRRTLTVDSNSKGYIGVREEIFTEGRKIGYAVILTGIGRIRSFLEAYNDMDYLGVVLLSGEQLLCANKDVRIEELPALSEDALFTREKEIGLSGFKLFLYCEKSFSGQVSFYFRIVMSIMILMLAAMVLQQRRLYLAEVGRREAELERERSLLPLLKKQIGAHFTVNTLNVVRAMVKKGEKEAASHICDELSTLLRYANAGDEYISLLDEFYVLRQYVGIMQARYPGRIKAEIEEEDFFDEVFIPRMLLQPLVENAIQHGLRGGNGTIRVSAAQNGGDIDVRVADDGHGMNEEQLDRLLKEIYASGPKEDGELSHVAMRNIQRRIRMVCGEGYGILVRSEENEGTEVLLHLPAEKEKPGLLQS